MSKLLIVSNRLSVPNGKAEAGGLAVALQEALNSYGGIWCGWSGKISETPESQTRKYKNVEYLTFDFLPKDYEDFYIGMCNSVIWPLFHYRIDLMHCSDEMFAGYERVNAHFADAVMAKAETDDLIWVHDYQLLTLGSHLRARAAKNRIGFFLHIPFPVPEVMTALPKHEEIIEAMCAYDVVGFQTDTDLQAFLRCVAEISGGTKTRTLNDHLVEVQAYGRRFKAGSFPISIDTENMVATAEKAANSTRSLQLKNSLNDRGMIIGVDRLDYTKGLSQRLEAFHILLQRHPKYSGQVSFVQITPPSRTDVQEYGKMREELERRAAHINGINADIDWVPIRYINKSFSREALSGFYRLARVGLVTPMRDGMNLVAKEYVASQNPEDPGVLILSQFAGAAQELDAALIVNPYDVESMAEVIHRALSMPLEERQERHSSMMEVLYSNDIGRWTHAFIKQLQSVEDAKIIIKRQAEYMPYLLGEKAPFPLIQ